MKKTILILFIATLYSCNSFYQLSSDKQLTLKINSEYLKEKNPVDLTKITDFEWNNYIIIRAYSIPEEEGKKYNVDLSNISEFETADDSKSILVFIKNKKSIKICAIRAELSENKLLKIE